MQNEMKCPVCGGANREGASKPLACWTCVAARPAFVGPVQLFGVDAVKCPTCGSIPGRHCPPGPLGTIGTHPMRYRAAGVAS